METICLKDVRWGDRAREDYGDITELAQSLSAHGLIQPIVLDDDNTLVAGGRRLTAAISLGWETIPIYRRTELSPLALKELELEENLRRKNLTWQEQAKLIAEIHDLKQTVAEEKWTSSDTGEYINKSNSFVQQNLIIAKALEENPQLAEEKDAKVAMTRIRRMKEMNRRRLVAELEPSLGFLHHGDALEKMKDIPDDSIDLVLLDPPYGVSIDSRPTRGGGATGSWTWGNQTYDDSTRNALELMDGLLRETARVLKPGAHCYLFFGLSLLSEVSAMTGGHLGYQKLPLIWAKNTHGNVDPYKRFGISYEAILFCWKGTEPRDLTAACHAVFTYPVNAGAKQHPSEKPAELYRRLITLSTHEKEVVLDPTAGSGISVASAISLNRRAIGIELDEDWFNLMEENVRKVKGGEANG